MIDHLCFIMLPAWNPKLCHAGGPPAQGFDQGGLWGQGVTSQMFLGNMARWKWEQRCGGVPGPDGYLGVLGLRPQAESVVRAFFNWSPASSARLGCPQRHSLDCMHITGGSMHITSGATHITGVSTPVTGGSMHITGVSMHITSGSSRLGPSQANFFKLLFL